MMKIKEKKKVLLICPYPIGGAPSQRFRFEQYLSFLQEIGYQITAKPFIDQKTWELLYKPGLFFQKTIGMVKSFIKRFLLLFQVHKFDFIFMHREAMQFGPPIFEFILCKVLKKKVLYDFDDAIWLKNHSDSNAMLSFTKWYSKVNSICGWVTAIQCGNQYLANYAKQFNTDVTIVPTSIDLVGKHNKMIQYEKDVVSIGWTGSHSTMHYLDFIVPIIEQLEKKYAIKFVVISDRDPNYDLNSLDYFKWDKATEIDDLAKIDIGIMPLKNNEWAEGKCAFKGLQYMALGIPTVMSPVGMNKDLIQHGENGFLVDSVEDWYDQLSRLIEDASLRKKIGLAGYQTVQNQYSVEALKPIYLSLFDKMGKN
jgi:glycosyltransferase involved in cell wall biosynthesis